MTETSSSRKLLLALDEAVAKLEEVERSKTEPIAIIGIGCRFPGGANDPNSFWRLLRNGELAIKEVPPDRWSNDTYYDPDPDAPGKIVTRLGGFLENVDQFDSHFFGISPREAASLDPQQRLLLEVSWEALENAGQTRERLTGSATGVFVGITTNDYARLVMRSTDNTELDGYFNTGNALNAAAGRLSYFLGLQGPSMAVDTACSSSLVAVHLACQSLRQRECDLSLAGGVNLILTPDISIAASRSRMLSPDGQCKTFDADADGYGRGEGCGVVILKRYSDARADGDPIFAVVRGSAVNQDGPSSGFTVPNGSAQQALIRKALANARLEAAQIDYIEAHGTGTSLGDPIEVNSLGAVFSADRDPDRPLLIGSVKANIGHLESAAGVAGLIKVALALKHDVIPPQRPVRELNPHIAWDKMPVRIPTNAMPWVATGAPRRAGVSSFGASGTNAHVILEQAPTADLKAAQVDRPFHLLTLSAKTLDALRDLAAEYVRYFNADPGLVFSDVCFSANTGRSHLNHRAAIIADSLTNAEQALQKFVSGDASDAVLVSRGYVNNDLKLSFDLADGAADSGQSGLVELLQSWGVAAAERGTECDLCLVVGSDASQAREGSSSVPVIAFEPITPDSDSRAWRSLLLSLGKLYVRGVCIDWRAFDRNYARARVPLPNYPWQRQRCWIPTIEDRSGTASTSPLGVFSPGDAASLLTQLANSGQFSEAEKKLLPKLLDGLIRQQKREKSSFYDWLYEVEWRPQAVYGRRLGAETLASPVEVVKGLEVEADLGEYYEVVRQLEEVSVDYVLRALLGMGWQCSTGERFSTDELRRELGVVAKYERLLGRLLEMLEEEGVLRREGERWEIVKRREPQDPAVEIARLRRSCPAAEAELTLLERCGSGLAEVLRGDQEALPLLFPEGDLSTASRLYGDSPAARVMNKLVQQAVAGALRGWPAGSGLRVLEVGAGTGGTTEYVLQALKGEETQYAYTDISGRFVGEGEEKFRGWGKVRGEVLDIERSPREQGFGGRKYELIVAANVLHATRDLRESLGHVRELLAPGGMLVLLEGTERVRFIDLIFGLTEGWWRYWDEELRPSYPLLTASQWTTLLEECGFQQASAVTEAEGVLSRQAVIVAQEPTGVPEAGRWLILADEKGVGERLAEMLEKQGEKVSLARTETPFDGLLEQAGGDDLTGVVHLWSLDAESTETLTTASLRAATKRSCGSALELVQALVKRSSGRHPRLWLVTRNAIGIDDRSAVRGLAQSPMWGLAKIISLEQPEYHTKCIDLDEQTADRSAALLLGELLADDLEGQVAYREEIRRVARLSRLKSLMTSRPFPIHESGTYLITGGLGGLGLMLADWLISRGAKHLVLMGRGAPSSEANRRLMAMANAGASVTIAHGDVSLREDVSRVLDEINRSSSPLRGIIHSAGVLDDGMLVHQDWFRFERVMGAKVDGSWNLYSLSREHALDFLVLFSSSASMLGSPGQGNHAAANAFLDSLAYAGRSSGFPVMSINWGAWAEIGAAAALGVGERIKAKGMGTISPEQGIETLSYLFANPTIQIGVLPMDWSTFPQQKESHLFLADFERVAPIKERSGFLTELMAAPARTRRALLSRHVEAQISSVLGLKQARLDPKEGFFDLGMDSLSSMELKNRLQNSLGVSLPNTLAFDYPNLGDLINYLARDPRFEIPAGADTRTTSSNGQGSELPDLEGLSREHLSNMIDSMIGDFEKRNILP